MQILQPVHPSSDSESLSVTLFRDTKYYLDKPLGSGSNGKVVRGYSYLDYINNLPIVHKAIKIFPGKNVRYFARERLALEALRGCQNVVQIEESFTTPNKCYIVMEECDGDLSELVKNSSRLEERDAKVCFLQMATGLIESHSRGVCHHDIKLDNYLIGKDGQIKLADFGYSISMSDQKWTEKLPGGGSFIKGQYSSGSPAYSSYQVLTRQPHSPILNDIYGLGICLYRLICGFFPFCDPAKDNKETLKKNVAASWNQANIYFPPHVSLEARELILGMIALCEEDRWGWDEIRRHCWCFA